MEVIPEQDDARATIPEDAIVDFVEDEVCKMCQHNKGVLVPQVYNKV